MVATEGINQIEWTPDGKVNSIVYSDKTISFGYDARGDRVWKKVFIDYDDVMDTTFCTFYLRDANGEVMAIYDTAAIWARFTPKLNTWLVYGSESHGRFETVKPLEETMYDSNFVLIPQTTFSRSLRFREYELKDHLGDVMLTFSDLKLSPLISDTFRLDLLSVNNYYPFGMVNIIS